MITSKCHCTDNCCQWNIFFTLLSSHAPVTVRMVELTADCQWVLMVGGKLGKACHQCPALGETGPWPAHPYPWYCSWYSSWLIAVITSAPLPNIKTVSYQSLRNVNIVLTPGLITNSECNLDVSDEKTAIYCLTFTTRSQVTTMIHFLLLFSRQGKLRLQKWFEAYPVSLIMINIGLNI